MALSGCGVVYVTPRVLSGTASDASVRVLPLTAETVLAANQAPYVPRSLPEAFGQFVDPGRAVAQAGTGGLPTPTAERPSRPGTLDTRIPPTRPVGPYAIGVGDVLLLATPQVGTTVEELSGLLAASNRRQGYTVQDDGAVAIPDVGRVAVAGMTLEDAEAALFGRLVANGIDPTFSLEVAEFNSQRVSVGGAVGLPAVIPVTLTPLFLDEALARAGGVTARDLDIASVRIYRDGTLYQIPLRELYSDRALQRIPLTDGDALFVDTSFDLDQAELYFEQRLRLADARQTARATALSALSAEIALRRGALEDQRANFGARLELGAVGRDHVFVTGEVVRQTRVPLPFGQQATLADVLYGDDNGVPTETGNPSQIYVLRGSTDPREFGGVTAWRLDARNAASLVVATRMEMRPNDVVFVAEQPITRWNRVLQQVIPSLIVTGVTTATQ